MSSRLLAVFTILLSLATTACANKKPQTPAGSNPPAAGVPFSLPKTVLNVQVVVVKTAKTQGEFCQFSDLFFHNADPKPPCDGIVHFKTKLKGFAVTGTGVPDDKKAYVIPAISNGGWGIDSSSSVELTESGLLNSIDEERTNRRAEIIVGIIKGLGGLATAALAPSQPPPVQPSGEKTEEEKKPKKLNDREFKERFLADWRLVWNYEQIKSANEARAEELVGLYEKRDPALFAARAAFREIEALEERLDAVMDGSRGASAAAALLAEMRNEIEKRQGTYFLGATDSLTWSPVFQVEPKENTAVTTDLFLKGNCGVVLSDASLIVKNPLPQDMKCDNPADATEHIQLSIPKAGAPGNYGDVSACPTGSFLKGIPFTIPAEATAKIETTEFPSQKVLIAQWGKTSCLAFPGSTYTASVSYYSATGAIKSVKFTKTSALSKELVDTLAGTASDIQKSILASREKAREEAKSKTLDDLTEQREILEEKVKIQAACATLNIKCDF
jgi:hypothetical protein